MELNKCYLGLETTVLLESYRAPPSSAHDLIIPVAQFTVETRGHRWKEREKLLNLLVGGLDG
jgi:hypothetical protein